MPPSKLGRESGIRTRVAVADKLPFQGSDLNHSSISLWTLRYARRSYVSMRPCFSHRSRLFQGLPVRGCASFATSQAKVGGDGRIRTDGAGVTDTAAFETAGLSHSPTSPKLLKEPRLVGQSCPVAWRRMPDSNRRKTALQAAALPLCQSAKVCVLHVVRQVSLELTSPGV